VSILQNQKHERYCNEYHVDLNRVEAIFRTECWPNLDPKDPKHREKASTIASKLHSDPFILARIQELEDERNVHCKLYAARIKKNLLFIADYLNTTTDEDKGRIQSILNSMTVKDIISANDKLMRHLGEYAADNQQKVDAAAEMMKRIQAQEDGLPSQAKDCKDERSGNAETHRTVPG